MTVDPNVITNAGIGLEPPKPLLGKKRAQEDYEVADQWKLMWWKFRKHRMAMIALPVIAVMYLLTMCCEFFSPTLPLERFKSHKDCPPTAIHLFHEGSFVGPYVLEKESGLDPVTYRRTFVDSGEIIKLGFFVKGSPYKLWNLIPTNIHFFGPQELGGEFFLMGTDSLGRDVFTRALYGGRVSLSFALVSIFFTFMIGLTLGGLSGYMGGLVDGLVQRTIDVIMSIPSIPLWMALAAALPKEMSSYTQYLLMCIIMSLIGWTGLARVVRGKILSVREEEFVTAARLSGATHKRVIFKHMIPMFMSYIIVSITGSIPATILGETALSFLGLGLQAPTISWGTLLQDCQTIEAIAQQPWKMFPAAFIVITVLMFNFAGDGLRDAADPYK
ncbi:MAG: ABC transporter permease [Oscillospiraceae bacterium]|jgi:peptide/nickel transport system permease protein|nr:ABC transporter permease [Oscillospiraceae bacterium]